MASMNEMRNSVLSRISGSVGDSFDKKRTETPISAPSSDNTPMVMDDAQSKLLRDQNYEALADSLLTNYNMRMNSQKYLRNALAAQGVNANGYGSTANIGINTTAMNNANTALQNYYRQEDQITSDLASRNDAKQTENDNQLATFITNYSNGDIDKIHQYLANYGYWDSSLNNGEGGYTEAFNSLDPTRKAYLQSLIQTASEGSSSTASSNIKYNGRSLSSWLNYNEVPGYDSETLKQTRQESSNDRTLDSAVGREINGMTAGIQAGQYKSGDVFRLTNNTDGANVYVLYFGGKFYRVAKDFYDSYDGGRRWHIQDTKGSTQE